MFTLLGNCQLGKCLKPHPSLSAYFGKVKENYLNFFREMTAGEMPTASPFSISILWQGKREICLLCEGTETYGDAYSLTLISILWQGKMEKWGADCDKNDFIGTLERPSPERPSLEQHLSECDQAKNDQAWNELAYRI
jgi:hypothetical protein